MSISATLIKYYTRGSSKSNYARKINNGLPDQKERSEIIFILRCICIYILRNPHTHKVLELISEFGKASEYIISI